MKAIILIFVSQLFIGSLWAQTAVNFNCNDCAGANHDLFSELDSGKVVLLCWVMPCGSCIGPSLTASNVVASFDSTYPGMVRMYLVDDYANTSCASLISWNAGVGIKNNATFSHGSIKMLNYGSEGMPKIVVVAGTDRRVFFNANNSVNGFVLQDSIQSALEHVILDIREPKGLVSGLRVFPNPAVETIQAMFHLQRATDVKITLTDLAGRTLYSIHYDGLAPGEHSFPIETKQLNKGSYLLRVDDGSGETVSATVIVQ